MNEVDQAKTQLRRVVETLQAIRSQLVGLQASIPPTDQETSLADLEEEPDAPTALRAALAGALHDRLDPLIEDLMGVAGLPHPQPGGEGEDFSPQSPTGAG